MDVRRLSIEDTPTASTSTAHNRPLSPALSPEKGQSSSGRATRRRSWGTRTDAMTDPLRLNLPPSLDNWRMDDPDPFASPVDSIHVIPSPREASSRSPYVAEVSGPSVSSLDSDTGGGRDDDEARLTSHAALPDGGWEHVEDAERSAASVGLSPRSRRKTTLRYSGTPSPLRRTGSALKSVSRNLRRVSLRVVNFSNGPGDDSIRLPDQDEEMKPDGADDEVLPDLRTAIPIRGKTLGFLGPESRIRIALFRFLVHPLTEPAILVLIVCNAVVLTIQASRTSTLPDNSSTPPSVQGYLHTWEDYALLALFVIFTLEAVARICVSGLFLDPEVPIRSLFSSPFSKYAEPPPASNVGPSNPAAAPKLKRGFTTRFRDIQRNVARPFVLEPGAQSEVSLHSAESTLYEKNTASSSTLHIRDPSQPTFFAKMMRSDTKSDVISLPFKLNVADVNDKVVRNVPYLRNSWSRIDFVAIVSFWITFALATIGVEHGTYHIGLFRALSVLRTARLLAVSSGTTTIMRSLKTARPLLTSVAYFVVFAMVLFSIIGVQSFKGSLRRTCWLQPTLGESAIQLSNQFCGGHIDPVTLRPTGFIQLDGQASSTNKGYICPLGQLCMEEGNPNTDVESFDTIYYAALQVIIVASANGWSPLMYSIIDSEFFVSCIFFILCVMVLNFWLINLFVAVITNTFSAIRSDTNKSAFGAAPVGIIKDDQDEGWAVVDGRRIAKQSALLTFYQYTRWCWVLLALASLVIQATRTVDASPIHSLILTDGELAITIAFDVEIILRILADLPDWRAFFRHANNWLDLILAIGSSLIQIPAIHDSAAYPWLTVFQLTRFYRVILEVPRMRPLMLAVFGNMYGLVNMSLFLLLVNYIAALVSIQLVRGDMDASQSMNFGQIFTAFLAMYQIFSSENWTTILYATTQAEIPFGQAVILALFISIWLLFANFIVLQMFIAVINENFSIAEESKRSQQATDYWANHQPQTTHTSWLRYLNPYRWVRANPVSVQVDHLPSGLVLPMQQALVQDYTMPAHDGRPIPGRAPGGGHYTSKSLTLLQSLFTGDTRSNDIPLSNIRHARRVSAVQDAHEEETERHLDILAAFNTETTTAEDLNDAMYERRALKADFIRDHPTFDKTFWIFSQQNPIRRLCQKLVEPANGERIFGEKHSSIAHPLFQLLLLLTVIGGLVTEFVATPLYRRDFYARHGAFRGAWFDLTEAAFGFVLVLELLVKVIADGFVFTPNAYLRSIWNILDFLILAGLLVNVTTALIFIGGLSRVTRSLKALRALRLITLIDKMRNTFESLILSGVSRILDAAILAILYMIPYAVWGLNIFAGQFAQCNDTTATGMADCNGEYSNTVLGDSFGFLVPRVWDDPSPSTTFSFDSFRSSLLILFEIVSLEGWIDVMNAATSITGPGLQPRTNASQANAIYFLVYHLLGGVVILTLFVSIIIGNFSSKTGTAFLTQPQREWIDLQKLIQRQKPSKRPKERPQWHIRAWCYDRAVQKHGWWSRIMTILFVVHIFALMTQTFTTQHFADELRNDFFLAVTIIYFMDIVVRSFGLGWSSFRADGWNIFDVVVAGGSFVTTLIARLNTGGYVLQLFQSIFLVSIAFKLVQRTNSLNKLFKTAMASLPVIVSLLSLWFILFLFFAILFVEVFSLTKWGSGETRNQNYSSIGTALVMLTFMTTGEGWNQYMHDFTISAPRCTPSTALNPDTDCGSTAWAFSLFIAWNLLSMYIFANMFTGVVVENFSYVFQSAGESKTITREEMRAFKKTWAEFANPRTGYLERSRFVAFFAKLTGVFEVKVYPTEYSTHNIMAACANPKERNRRTRIVDGLDLHGMSNILGTIDYKAIRKRRMIYSRLYHEANISHEYGRGISFTNMLHLLAHHKLIVDRDALVLKDLLIRTETNKLVTDLVNLDRVRSLLKMISHRRRFLAHRERTLQAQSSHYDIPAIVVGDPSTPPSTTQDITSPRQFGLSSPELGSPSGSDYLGPDFSTNDTPVKSGGLQRNRNRRTSDVSMLSTADLSRNYGRDSMSIGEDDAQDVLSSVQNSMWGEMMLEAEDDEL